MFELPNPIVFRDRDVVRLAVACMLSLLFHAAILVGGGLVHSRSTPRQAAEALQATLVPPMLPAPPVLLAPEVRPATESKRDAKPEPKPVPRRAGPGFTAVDAVRMAQRQVARQLLYPPEAVARGLEGQATVRLFFDESGSAIAARLESSSGYAILDDAAVKAAGTVRIPAGTFGELLLPVRFRLH